MDPVGIGGGAMLLVIAMITGVIGYLAVQQSKIKRQIEESRRQRERDELTALGGLTPPTTLPPPDIPLGATPDITPSSLSIITPGGTPAVLPPHQPPGHDAGGHPPPDTGGHDSGGGFDGGGGHH